MKMRVDAEFRRFDQEERQGRAVDKEGNTIPGKVETYLSRVLRVEVNGEGCIGRLWPDSPVVVPEGVKKGDMIELEINGFQTVKEATYLQITGISIKGGKTKAA